MVITTLAMVASVVSRELEGRLERSRKAWSRKKGLESGLPKKPPRWKKRKERWEESGRKAPGDVPVARGRFELPSEGPKPSILVP